MAAKPIKVTQDDFQEKVMESPVPVVVDFWAEWCGPCHMIAPVVEQLSEEYDGQVTFAKLNVDENPEIAMRYQVHGIPTLIAFQNGQEATRVTGALPKPHLVRALAPVIPQSAN